MCPASTAGPGSALPRATLDRWIAVADACASWHNGMEVDEIVRDQFAWLDPVQRDICAALLRTYTELMADYRNRFESLDTGFITLHHPDPNENAAVTAAYQWALTGDSGHELIKLKTGLYGSRDAEKAVLLKGKDPDDTIFEVMLRAGTVDPLEMDEESQNVELARLFALWDETRSDDWRPTRQPGMACYTMCNRPARCGQYPADEATRIYNSTRTIRLSKTSVNNVSFCHRQVAWKAIYQIPTDEGEEVGDEVRDTGREFHELCEAALIATDSKSMFKESLEGIPENHKSALADLWAKHEQIENGHTSPVTYKQTEYALGATLVTVGRGLAKGKVVEDQPVSVVLIGRADAVGRESDGTPAVVELRTGASVREPGTLELDIYALGASRLVKASRVAIHHHLVGLPSPECRREVYEPDDLRDAATRLGKVASVAAGGGLGPSGTGRCSGRIRLVSG